MKHKHSDVLHAFADGIECEYFSIGTDRWVQINDISVFSCDVQVRIKPEAQKEQETHIKNHEKVLKAYRELVEAQDKKICELATKLEYANQTIENLTVEPPKEQEPQYLYVYNSCNKRETWLSQRELNIENIYGWNYMGKVKVEK